MVSPGLKVAGGNPAISSLPFRVRAALYEGVVTIL